MGNHIITFYYYSWVYSINTYTYQSPHHYLKKKRKGNTLIFLLLVLKYDLVRVSIAIPRASSLALVLVFDQVLAFFFSFYSWFTFLSLSLITLPFSQPHHSAPSFLYLSLLSLSPLLSHSYHSLLFSLTLITLSSSLSLLSLSPLLSHSYHSLLFSLTLITLSSSLSLL